MSESRPESDVLRCPQCGYELQGLGAPRCPECGVRFVISGVEDGRDPRVNSYIVLSILMLFFLGLPGIVPLIYSVRTLTAVSRHDYAAARRHSRTAVIWLVIGLAIGVVFYAFLFMG